MPTDEGRQVLELLAQGKIDADQAYRLLRALGDVRDESSPPPPPPPSAPERAGHGRTLQIRVTEAGKQKVNIAVPLGIARLRKVIGWNEAIRKQLSKFGVDVDEILTEIDTGRSGMVLDVGDDSGRVQIFIS